MLNEIRHRAQRVQAMATDGEHEAQQEAPNLSQQYLDTSANAAFAYDAYPQGQPRAPSVW